MSSGAREEINFWPGYVDALINVLLNLLFLVGVFTVGLVVLNMQAAMIQKEEAKQEIREALQGTQSAQQKKKVKELLDKLKPAPTVEEPPQAAEELTSKEIRIKRRQAGDAVQPSDAQTPQTASIGRLPSPQEVIEQITKGRVVGRVPFGMDQFTLPDPAVLPANVLGDTTQNLQLVVLSEPSNPRLAREAFSRLVAVRNGLTGAGFATKQLQIKVLARPEAAVVPADVELSVFLVAPQ